MSERRRNVEDSSGRTIDFGEVQLGGLLPEAAYNMAIKSLEERYSQDKGILMYMMELRVEEPLSLEGRGHYELMVFGTTPFNAEHSKNPKFVAYSKLNDPDAEDPLTREMSRGIQMFKQLLHYAGVDMTGKVYMPDMIDLCNSGTLKVGVRLRHEEQRTGQYAGSLRCRIAHVFEVGREAPGFNTKGGSRQQARGGSSEGGQRQRRAASPEPTENMNRALASEKTRQQLINDMGEDALSDDNEPDLVMGTRDPIPTQDIGRD